VPLQRKLTIILVVLTVLGVILAMLFAPQRSRTAIAVMAAGGAGYFVIAWVAHSRYAAVLREAARELGLSYLATAKDEKDAPLLSSMKLKAESDVFRWKVDGRLPAVVGELEGFPVVVRVPVGLDFDAGAPDSTRIAVYHEVKLAGFAVYDRSGLRKTPKGRPVTFGDPSFDERFLVTARREEEAHTVLTPPVRAAFLEAGGTGFRGVEVNRYGVFVHEDGKVSSAGLLKRRLELALTVARAARELAGDRTGV